MLTRLWLAGLLLSGHRPAVSERRGRDGQRSVRLLLVVVSIAVKVAAQAFHLSCVFVVQLCDQTGKVVDMRLVDVSTEKDNPVPFRITVNACLKLTKQSHRTWVYKVYMTRMQGLYVYISVTGSFSRHEYIDVLKVVEVFFSVQFRKINM